MDARIAAARKALGQQVVVLGHHYQRDDIVKFADFRGDSFKLSQLAAQRQDASYIVFCGVHFMAESADILSGTYQQVLLPNLDAGCSMADMASIDDVKACWDVIASQGPVVPITYMNSSAELKAFCGQRGGAVCTSSNAPAVLRWAFGRSRRVLFFPDEHLGRNTARTLGIPEPEIVVWDPSDVNGGNGLDALERAKLVLWKGYCSVHMRFSTEQIRRARERFPGVTVVVHPECRSEVVEMADVTGSTELIAKTIDEGPAGSQWAVGTEINLVSRLAKENPDKLVFCLDPVVCPCSTMYRIHPAYLLWTLEELVKGRATNVIAVPDRIARDAKRALDVMLSIG